MFAKLKPDLILPGFSPGRLYCAFYPRVGDTENPDVLVLEDDDGAICFRLPEEFVLTEQAFAIYTYSKPIDGSLGPLPGEVVLVETGGERAGAPGMVAAFHLVEHGGGHMAMANLFRLADEQLLFPDVWVMDRNDGAWKQILRVDKRGWLTAFAPNNQEGECRPPTAFRFAVQDGEVLSEPWVKCIDRDTTSPNLVVGDIYRLLHGYPGPTGGVEVARQLEGAETETAAEEACAQFFTFSL